MSYAQRNLINDTPTVTQRQIVELLRQRPELAIPELVEYLEISTRSVYRDLKRLASAGLVVRTHDRVALPSFAARLPSAMRSCALCGRTVRERTSFTIINRYGGVIWACCAHCGALLLGREPHADMAFTCDFIQERIVDARDASYLVESRAPVCCAPGIISFVNADDARGFQLGFGGTVMSFVELQAYLQGKMGTLDQDATCCANHVPSNPTRSIEGHQTPVAGG